jgi:hypothetical protein
MLKTASNNEPVAIVMLGMSLIKYFLISLCFCISLSANSQTHIDVYTGVFTDLANKNKFQQFNLGCQIGTPAGKHYRFFVQLQASLPVFSSSFTKPAFTPNPLLPLQVTVQEKLTPSIYAFALGHSFLLTKPSDKQSSWQIILLTGYGWQAYGTQAKVPAEYALLNAELPQKLNGFFLGIGTAWQYALPNKNRIFVQLNANVYPFNNRFKQPSTFKAMLPLQLNVGYGFNLSTPKK